ncbi:FIG01018673: hypothetical protein [hydrothermal vent metagenome]|uniref:SnoaL-like domain-containing protein n=1 Tax=hydrothermal vent metagenome TaxID=652676 RepID=A0A3B0QXQ9_9ZZZZ
MQRYLLLLSFLTTLYSFSQPNTDIFLFDLSTENGNFELSNIKNISNNEGYDNQPSFLNNNTILYAGTRKGQTDIVKYTIPYDSKVYINLTEGSEYSPLKIPNQKAISAIRLDKDGTQKLYKYNLRNGESEVLVDDIIIGYHVWYNENILVSSVLEDGSMSLYTTTIKNKKNDKVVAKVGRSLHKIPNTNLISYISKESDSLWEIKSLNPTNGKTKFITKTLPKTEDMCWLSPNTILMGKGYKLYKNNNDKDWIEVASLKAYGITNITRLAVSPDGTKLALVGEGGKISDSEASNSTKNKAISDAEKIIQTQLEAYNNRDIDAFMATYTKDIKLYDYPEKLKSEGQNAMRESYNTFFKNTPDLHAYIKNRIVIGNKVIDEEQVTINGKIYNAVAIYEVENGKIKKVTFIQ